MKKEAAALFLPISGDRYYFDRCFDQCHGLS